jgi:ribosomal protein S18 acetylase RimI-like enzyme
MELPALTIRDARIEDAAALANAEREVAKTPGFLASQPFELSDERFAEKIGELSRADNGKYFVAQVGNEIVAHAMLDPLRLAACRHVVHLTIVVHPGWQGKGVGRVLLGKVIEWAKSTATVEKIELHVRSSNMAALELYRTFGFAEIGRWTRRVKVAAGQYLDDVAMELWVKEPADFLVQSARH